ncbi:SURP and G-patch domain-containing protein 1 isoform X3 [Orcinus orca]|uniref:SURP and G-patch domain-containing protein 1 isoform X3 n=1 Tax=Sagmatias obliquidens TaxID=3371155 RepID=UPI000F4465A7|nr:SURP and G-patch domain-containing protein 1 isoform X3 [Lagenorhynchus obliquidens]XP_033257253.1 SURP and G-patch domain-containing protein 1 isoform X3 [Orcinus orca]
MRTITSAPRRHHPSAPGGAGALWDWMSLKMDNRDVAGKANRWFGVAPPKSGKMNMNILHQEELIAQKKREIEAKMEQKAKQNQVASPQPRHPGEIANAHNSNVSNKFANDGSFLQQFLKLQKAQTSTDARPSAPAAPPRVLPRTGKRPPLISSPPGQMKNYVHAKQLPVASRPSVFQSPDEDEEEDYEQWLEIKVSPPEGAETRKVIEKLARFVAEGGPELEKVAMENYKDNPAFSFLHDKNSREFLYYRKKVAEIRKEAQKLQAASQKVSPPEDEEVKNLAEKLARFIADGGPEVETIALQNNRENQAFSFLYEPNSQGYKYYRQKLEEFRKAKAGPTGTPTAPDLGLKRRSPPETPLGSMPTATACPTSSAPLPNVNPSSAAPGKPATTANMKRKRKSRWGPEEDKVELPPAELVQRDVDASPSPLSGPQGSRLREGEARGSGGCHRAFGCPEEAAEGAAGDATDVRHDHAAQASNAGHAAAVGEGAAAAPAWLRQRRGGGQRAGHLGAPAAAHGDGQDSGMGGAADEDGPGQTLHRRLPATR